MADTILIDVSGITVNRGEDLLPEADHCGSYPDARDTNAAGDLGWWFYLNYTAALVTNATGF